MHKNWLVVSVPHMLEVAQTVGILGTPEPGEPAAQAVRARADGRHELVAPTARPRRNNVGEIRERNYTMMGMHVFATKTDATDFVTEYARSNPNMKWIVFEACMLMETPHIPEPVQRSWDANGELV